MNSERSNTSEFTGFPQSHCRIVTRSQDVSASRIEVYKHGRSWRNVDGVNLFVRWKSRDMNPT